MWSRTLGSGTKKGTPLHYSTLLTGGLERFPPCDELGIATPFCGVPDSTIFGFAFCNGFAFGFQINGKILVRSVYAGVSKPVGDCAKVDA